MLVRPGHRRPWILAPETAAYDEGAAINVALENEAALARLAEGEPGPDRLVIVPGFTPLDADRPVRLTDTTRRRLARAREVKREHGARAILCSGGNVHPDATPFNEALEMKRHLLGEGVRPDRVLIDPYARHSTTNLRNAGRLLLSLGLPEALVVTTFGQGFYFGAQDLSTFRLRCERELGYGLGELTPNLSFTVIRFRPSPDVWRVGEDPLDP